MRYSKEHKAETHARIVKKASVRLRERGAHGIGVADLMKEAGLTHGGFYAHFDSREALVVEAFDYAMDRAMQRWRQQSEQLAPEERLPHIVNAYLSPQHRDNPGQGCAVPSLGAEIARESVKTRKAFAAKLDEMIDMLAQQFPHTSKVSGTSKSSGTSDATRKQAMVALATMMGTIVMARVAGSGELSEELLAAGREAVLVGTAAPKQAPRRKPAKTSSAKASASARD